MLRILLLFSVTVSLGFSAHAQQAPKNGFYWFKSNTDFELASNNLDSGYYNPQSKTLIFLHGWQNNSIGQDSYEAFDYIKHDHINGFSGDLVRIWKDKGWNVGAYYWREFADDDLPWAESKIWSNADVFGMRMKVKNTNGDVEIIKHNNLPAHIKNSSVSDLFYDAYLDAMSNHGDGEIRLVGHSLGSQLALAAARKISDAVMAGEVSEYLHPDRLGLLDPFFSNILKPFWFFTTTGEKSVEAAEILKDAGVVFELYRTSLAPVVGQIVGLATMDDDSVLKINKLSAHQNMRLWYVGLDEGPIEQIANRHIAAPYLYFESMKYEAPTEVRIGGWVGPWYFRHWNPFARIETGKKALSAATSGERVKEMMTSQYYWDQVEGRYTNTTHDNQFVRKRR